MVMLPVVRALGPVLSGNTTIHTLSAKNGKINIPKFSKYIQSHFQLHGKSEEEILDELLERIKETGAGLILPVDEEYFRLLTVLKPKLQDHVSLPPLPDAGLFESLVNKALLNRLLEEYKLPHAETYPLGEVNASELKDDFFPCLLKPVRGSSGNGIIKLSDRFSLVHHTKNLPADDYVVQEFIPGDNLDCSLLAEDGIIKAYTIQRGLESRKFSFSTAIHFEKNELFLKVVQELIRQTGYSGIAHLDYRRDKRDGQCKLIDFNARYWVSLLGSKAAGVNFTLLNCLAAMGIPFGVPDFEEVTYMMGKSSISHYRRKLLGKSIRHASKPISTDLWDRVSDPFPELIRYSTRLYQRFRKQAPTGNQAENSVL